MQKSHIQLAETDLFSSVILDYIAGAEQLKPFYQYSPSLDIFQQVIEDKSKESTDRKLLVEVLNEQYANLNTTLQVKDNIASLSDNKTFTVTTGHQLCIFTGPLYFIYKIVSTINLADGLNKKYPENNFVPVYWMASEDHDFEEINHLHLFGKKLVWDEEHKGAVGEINTASLNGLIDQLKEILGENENAEYLLQLFTKAYLENKNLSDATRYLVNELFQEYGLVILDAQDARLKRQFAEIMKDDLLNHSNSKAVTQSIAELAKIDVSSQVNPREINLFYLFDDRRERIEQNQNGDYVVLNSEISFEKEELLQMLEEHPERFSPNVVLRPLYQEKILPNLAYLGGPGELAYWLEYKRMFEVHKINFPVLMPRNFVLWIDAATGKKMEKLGVTQSDLFLDVETLIKQVVQEQSDDELELTAEADKMKNIYEGIARRAESIDPTLRPSVEAELQKQLKALDHIQSKLMRAEKQKHETAINQVRKIKEKLFPGGTPQERYDNFIPYYLRYGADFIQTLKKELEPFDQRMNIFVESPK